ncbi:MAG TPA: lmo0937 family membrane protein [Candidatus Saccharimonadales bacterium]|nr:lmo0937 family membrane protein [Candidatus Saccharimonadales bacterium]
MLLTIVIVLGILWLLGLLANIGGGFIHLLLIVALVVFVYDLIVGRRSRV